MFPRFNRSQAILASVLLVVLIAGLRIAAERPWESTTTRAYRLCAECGLGVEEIEGLIDTMRHSTLTRGENLELFYATFEDRSQAEPCEPCADALLDAAAADEWSGKATRLRGRYRTAWSGGCLPPNSATQARAAESTGCFSGS